MSSGAAATSLSDRLKRLDAHSSVASEFRVYTVQGAVLSVLTLIAIGMLVLTEVWYNFQVTVRDRVHVNETSPAGLEMEFDVSLPSVPCDLLQIDANDPTGQTQSLHLDRQHHVWKHRIKMRPDGRRIFIGDKSKLELGSTLKNERDLMVEIDRALEEAFAKEADAASGDEEEDANCGSCYGAGEEGECCNSCDDVRRVYRRKGWVLDDLTTIKQCKTEGIAQRQEDEGCNVHGVVALSTGGGNLHLAPGKDMQQSLSGAVTMMDLLMQAFQVWNVSHTIHKLRFGPEYPAAINQLDGAERKIEDGHGMYQYYIQVVPTLYKFRNGTSIQTNQYSVTEHLRHVHPGSARGLPGIFFFYEVSPLHVEIIEEYRQGWIPFLTSLCAIIGGVVTVAGLLDQTLYHWSTARQYGGANGGGGLGR